MLSNCWDILEIHTQIHMLANPSISLDVQKLTLILALIFLIGEQWCHVCCQKHQHVLNDLAFIHRGLIYLSPIPFRVTAEKNNKQLSIFFCLTRDIPAKEREVFRPARRNHRPVSSPAERGVPHLSAKLWELTMVPLLQIKNGCFVCKDFPAWPPVTGI